MKEIIQRNFDLSPAKYDEYERLTGRFASLASRLYHEMAARAAVPLETVLDAGAGTGISSEEITARGATPIALDLSHRMLGSNPAADRVQGDFDQLPFVSDSFDAVAFTASLFLTPKPDRAVTEARRVLCSGGTVGAVVPLGWRTKAGEDVFEQLSRTSRSPTDADAVERALRTEFDIETGRWSFETSPNALRAFHSVPAMAARLYPKEEPSERIRRANELLTEVDEPLEQHWRWFVGT